jgi:hypothetical protein
MLPNNDVPSGAASWIRSPAIIPSSGRCFETIDGRETAFSNALVLGESGGPLGTDVSVA